MNSKNKKIYLSSLMLFALLLLLVGVTYTALTYINKSDDNSINLGRISMSYSEPSNALELINALPMSDEEGLVQTNYFEFTVSSNASTNENDDIGVTIPYEVNISDIEIDSDKTILPKDKIKVVLTKVTDGSEEQVIEPTLISNLTLSTLNTGSSKVYDTKNIHKNNNGTITTRYRLRAWIDKSFELDNTKVYQYKFRVNVNSNTTPLSILKVNKIMLEVWEDNSVAINKTNNNVLRLASESGRWVEVLDNKTLTEDDRIRITFIYNNNIKGTVPTLSLKFGESVATGEVSNGVIVDNKLSYEYIVTKEDKGKLNINELTGGSIKDEADNIPLVLTKDEKEAFSVNAETLTFGEILAKTVVTSGDGLYSTTETNDGRTSYYYKGNVTNNYVKLTEKSGDAMYRIVRINEDGSIRLIRQDGINNNVKYPFNKDNNGNYKYVYYSNNNIENGIMKRVNDWYASVIEKTALDNKVVESNFCEQARVSFFDNSMYLTVGNQKLTSVTMDYIPNLKCVKDANGKGPLSMKVGLLSENEVALAGIPLGYNGISSASYNVDTYLQINNGWWLMSPAGFASGFSNSRDWQVNSKGFVTVTPVSHLYCVRPVISLSKDVVMVGKGTKSEPFEIIFD